MTHTTHFGVLQMHCTDMVTEFLGRAHTVSVKICPDTIVSVKSIASEVIAPQDSLAVEIGFLLQERRSDFGKIRSDALSEISREEEQRHRSLNP